MNQSKWVVAIQPSQFTPVHAATYSGLTAMQRCGLRMGATSPGASAQDCFCDRPDPFCQIIILPGHIRSCMVVKQANLERLSCACGDTQICKVVRCSTRGQAPSTKVLL
jgi:hypothetical protein